MIGRPEAVFVLYFRKSMPEADLVAGDLFGKRGVAGTG